MKIIDAAFDRNRTSIIILFGLVVAGLAAYVTIPKEAEPDVAIPIIYVSMSHEGISPNDAERLLVRPMEKELQSIEGIKEMTAIASEGHASVTLEFDAGFDSDRALQDVRQKVDLARSELPSDTDEPTVNEINVALFPVLTAVLSGDVDEATLVRIARDLKDRIEALPNVLEVDIAGDREEVIDIVVDPLVMETYHISYEELFSFVRRNNQLVAAGSLDTGAGRFAIKVPGVIEQLDDVLSMPVKTDGDRVITVGDLAEVHAGFKDPNGFARVGERPALALEVSKRLGANIIETIAEVRAIVAEVEGQFPAGVEIQFLQDKSEQITSMLGDLQNNVISAVILVMIVIIAALGWRAALLVGVAIPGSFLVGILVIDMLGLTLNIVSLFSLILVVGMLVDGAIVVAELAERRKQEGFAPREAYSNASKRMAWPIIASTATTLVVFLPLLFWPGVIGQFMKYLPITVIACLSASLAMALIFVPVLGATLSSKGKNSAPVQSEVLDGPLTQAYRRLLDKLLRHPAKVLGGAIGIMIAAYVAYFALGRGVELFPDVEPDFAQVQVRARGDLSVYEKDVLVKSVETRIQDIPGIVSVYARTRGSSGGRNRAPDVIGVIQLGLDDWQTRDPAAQILDVVRERTADIPGIIVEARVEDSGPSGGKPVELDISASESAALEIALDQVLAEMEELGGFIDIEDSRTLPGNEWRLIVDRSEAARYGADVALLGNAVKLITNGIKLADYRPETSDDEVDIRVRFYDEYRHLDQLQKLRVMTPTGLVPIGNFVDIEPAQKTGTLNRSAGRRVLSIKGDVEEGMLVADRVNALRDALQNVELAGGALINFKGEDEDQQETMAFLGKAFLVAIALMLIMLVTQFNSIYQALLVLSAIIFSTAGVLLGLLVTAQPFGIVMCGIGVIALAGIVVNNNIILIDTFNRYRAKGMSAVDAAMETGTRRLRPVLLTAVTTILGLMPMVLSMNLDFAQRKIEFGAPSTQWWTQLSSSIAGGLAFATLLTLLLTPCLLVLGARGGALSRTLYRRLLRRPELDGAPLMAKTQAESP